MRRQQMEARVLGHRRVLMEQQPLQGEDAPWTFHFSQMFTTLPNEILGLVARFDITPAPAIVPCHRATSVLV